MTNAPSLSELMDIDTYGLHLLLHNQPGSVSPVSGVTMDFSFRVRRQAIFGYTLSRLLSPVYREAQAIFRRQFAFLVALPRRYREAIVDHDRANPLSPFVPQRGPAFSTHWVQMDAQRARNMSLQDITKITVFPQNGWITLMLSGSDSSTYDRKAMQSHMVSGMKNCPINYGAS